MSQTNDSLQASDGEVSTAASLQPMGFGDILDSMFSLYRNRFRLFVGICGVYFVYGLVVDLLIGISVVSLASSGQFDRLMLMAVALYLIGAVVMLFVVSAIVFASAEAFLGKQITVGAAFKRTERRFWPYLGSNCLYGLVVGLLMITCLGIPLAIFFAFRWIFCSLAAVFEGKSAVRALKRSSELVKGGWWRVFGVMIAIFLLVFFVQTILQISLTFVLGLTQIMGDDGNLVERLRQIFSPSTGGDEDVADLWRQILLPQLTTWKELIVYSIQIFISLAINCLMLPVSFIGVTLVYFDRRIRKEGFDIEMRVTGEPV
ncbi:MAG: hypothetical protein OXN17_04310 [Candidatus Poribacteria bacterium]|nr:hypothetical protein [Candidatus Poribacteria bacterium]MDE0505288.1 hypothetical protein [Candidatus Poribacteria bacterium]